MYIYFKFFLLLSFVCLIDGYHRKLFFTTIHHREITCNNTVFNKLDQCWNNLAVMNQTGIPSTYGKLQKACRAFNAGMECFEIWSTTCLLQKRRDELDSIVTTSLKTYKFLCTDAKYRQKYFQHWNCYQRISPFWLDCDRKFNNFNLFNGTRSARSLCCIRLAYNRCVIKFTMGLCSKEATKFLQSMLESLTQSSVDTYKSECMKVDLKSCFRLRSAKSSTKYNSLHFLSLCNAILISVVVHIVCAVFTLH